MTILVMVGGHLNVNLVDNEVLDTGIVFGKSMQPRTTANSNLTFFDHGLGVPKYV